MANPNGKTALITGSTDGVGRGVAKRLGEDGWRVLVHGRDRGRGEAVVAEIKDAGGAAEFLAADLSSLAEVRRLAGAVLGPVNALVILAFGDRCSGRAPTMMMRTAVGRRGV
jgi:NAD(P)-dependent dehydrogenase (short-subunit alcohol dehydrogenase family)